MSAIAICGNSGTGKSTSFLQNDKLGIKGLHPKETVLINVSQKDPPGKKANELWRIFDDFPVGSSEVKKEFMIEQITKKHKRQLRTSSAARIINAINTIDCCCPGIKNIIIDDAQYLQGFQAMSRIAEKGWDKMNDIAMSGFSPVDTALSTDRKDLLVFFLYHHETSEDGKMKIKTAGKAVDQYILLDGLFTVNLYTEIEIEKNRPTYHFRTNTLGNDSCKSPHGMFDDFLIPNDLGLVRDKFLEYYS